MWTYSENTASLDFLNTLHSFAFFPTIKTYTRVTNSCKSAIDNIVTNIRNTKLETGVVIHDISDHYPSFLFTDFGKKGLDQVHKSKTKVIKSQVDFPFTYWA